MIVATQKENETQHARLDSQQPEKRRWTTDEYLKMAELGILAPNEKLELIDGEIYKKMSPVGLPHYWCVNRLTKLFERTLGDKVFVSIQNPLWLDEHNAPEPDVVLLPMMNTHIRPGAKDALLVVEVSDSTLDIDRKLKLPLYAKFEVAEVWLINLIEQCVEVYREPNNGAYRQMKKYEAQERVSAMKFPEVELSVGEVLGAMPLNL